MKNILNLYRASYSGLPKQAWFLSFIVLINRSGSMVLFFLVLYLTSKLNYSISDAGQIISIYGIGALVGTFGGGWLTDRIGTKKVQLTSLISSAVGYIILGYIQTGILVGIIVFILAIVVEAFRPANSAAFAEVCPPKLRSRGFALLRLAVNLGMTIGPAIGGFLATVNYLYLFWVDGFTCLVAAIFLHFFMPDEEPADAPSAGEFVKSYSSPWHDFIFLTILVLIFLSGLVFVQLLNTWPLYLREQFNLLEDQIGLLLGLNAILVVIVEMPLIHSLEHKNPYKIISIGSLFLLGGFAILPLGYGLFFAAFTVIIWTLGEILVFPLVAGIVANRAAAKIRGRYMGMFNFSFALSFAAGPALGTWIYELFGSTTLWFISGLLGILISCGFLFLKKMARKYQLG